MIFIKQNIICMTYNIQYYIVFSLVYNNLGLYSCRQTRCVSWRVKSTKICLLAIKKYIYNIKILRSSSSAADNKRTYIIIYNNIFLIVWDRVWLLVVCSILHDCILLYIISSLKCYMRTAHLKSREINRKNCNWIKNVHPCQTIVAI